MFRQIGKLAFDKIGGEGGIRTLDTLLTYTHFPGVRFQPLTHFTVFLQDQDFWLPKYSG